MINSIRNFNFNSIRNINKTSVSFMGQLPKYLKDALNGDVFIKSQGPSEEDYEKMRKEIPNDFEVWAQENDFINSGLQNTLTPPCFIGEGFDHAVYGIANNPNYVLRIDRNYYNDAKNIDFSAYEIKDTRDMEILDDNYGQQVAIIKDASNQGKSVLNPTIEVLKRQYGFPDGNPSPRALYHQDGTLREHILPYEDDSRKAHFARSMKALAEFPPEAYDKLIDDLLLSGEAGYKFDHFNSNNFLIDEDNQRINIIDMNTAPKPHKDRFGNTLYALVNLEFFNEYTRKSAGYEPENPNEINETIGNMLTVLDKYTDAMKRKMQKYNVSSYEFSLLLNHIVSSFWLRAGSYEDKLAKLRDMGVLYEGQAD